MNFHTSDDADARITCYAQGNWYVMNQIYRVRGIIYE